MEQVGPELTESGGATSGDVSALESVLSFHLYSGPVAKILNSHDPAGFFRSWWRLCPMTVMSATERGSDRVWVWREGAGAQRRRR